MTRLTGPLADHLEYYRDLGIRELYDFSAAPDGAAEIASAKAGVLEAAPTGAAEIASAKAPATRSADRLADETPTSALHEALRQEVAECRKCRLCETRTQTVFCDGVPGARVMFVGEAPGADEDAQGVPFVGRAGQLLTKMIENGMGLPRSSVYIANVLKCRPPGNRDPQPDEAAACRGYLEAQIDLVKPEVLVALGKHAAQFLLDTEEPISRLRGKWGSFHGVPVLPTFHPSYLLRSPDKKKEAWDDLQKVMHRLGLSVPKSSSRTGTP